MFELTWSRRSIDENIKYRFYLELIPMLFNGEGHEYHKPSLKEILIKRFDWTEISGILVKQTPSLLSWSNCISLSSRGKQHSPILSPSDHCA